MSRPNGVEKPSFDLLHHERRTIEQVPSLFQTVSVGNWVNRGSGIVLDDLALPAALEDTSASCAVTLLGRQRTHAGFCSLSALCCWRCCSSLRRCGDRWRPAAASRL